MPAILPPMADQRPEGNRIRELRLAAGFSQEQLAVHAGLTRVTLAGIENSPARMTAASLETLERIAAALRVPTVEMIPRLKVTPLYRHPKA